MRGSRGAGEEKLGGLRYIVRYSMEQQQRGSGGEVEEGTKPRAMKVENLNRVGQPRRVLLNLVSDENF